jgi:PAS domain S-box-containing protein
MLWQLRDPMNTTRFNGEQGSPVWLGVCARRLRMGLVFLGILSCALPGRIATAQQNPKNVLLIYSTFEGRQQFANLLETAVRTHVRGQVNFYSANLSSRRADEKAYWDSVAQTLAHEYENTRLDAVIAISLPAFQFAIKYRDKVFPGVPIVFTLIDTVELNQVAVPPGVTGTTTRVGLSETIDLALRLKPDTQTIAVIDGDGTIWWGVAHQELLRRQDRIKEIDIIGPPSSETLKRIAELPPHTAILFQLAPLSSIHPTVSAYDVLTVASLRAPTYSAWRLLCLDYGCIGGGDSDWQKAIQSTGELTARILAGAPVQNIPVVSGTGAHIFVDWRALQRWHIPQSDLPPGTEILYRPPTMWEQYRKYIVAAIAVIALQALLILALFWQRARKRKAEAILRESEKRFRVMADATPSLIWMCDTKGKITYLNEQRLAFTGPDRSTGYGDTWFAFIHPDDIHDVLTSLWQALKDQRPFSKEYRLHRSDGTYRWMFDVASPRVNGDGSFGGFIGSATDVTDQKLAQQALENVSGQLIEAQEKERTRIARDLHDDICQRLAVLSMELEQAKHVRAGSLSTADELEIIRRHCSEIAGDVQSLSHELHSSKLDYLGVAAAVRGFCREFSKQHGVIVDFTDNNVPQHLPKDISLCLFRVAQEALHNAVKHSGATHFTVELSAIPGPTPGPTPSEVRLEVTDAGTGFDIEAAKRNRGLGLASMQERVHLVHGRFSIESKPGRGTTILVTVPLPAQNPPASEEPGSGTPQACNKPHDPIHV